MLVLRVIGLLSIVVAGDATVRELKVSRFSLRLGERIDSKVEGKEDKIHAKLTGQTIDVPRNGLVRSIVFTQSFRSNNRLVP